MKRQRVLRKETKLKNDREDWTGKWQRQMNNSKPD
jgi:hypothetical protein